MSVCSFQCYVRELEYILQQVGSQEIMKQADVRTKSIWARIISDIEYIEMGKLEAKIFKKKYSLFFLIMIVHIHISTKEIVYLTSNEINTVSLQIMNGFGIEEWGFLPTEKESLIALASLK